MKTDTLNKENLKRYKGHISLCEIDLPGQTAICNANVLIVGAGGLGSPVALYLAAAGVGHIGIIDADNVSLGNLQRQIMHGTDDIGSDKVASAAQAMSRINPGIEITEYRTFLTNDNAEEIVSGYDIVADCTDNFATRLLINDICVKTGKPYVFGSVSRFTGQLFTHIPGSADLRTIFGSEASEDTAPCEITGILNSVVGVIGSLQATEILKFITKAGDLCTNRLLIFDAITMEFTTYQIDSSSSV